VDRFFPSTQLCSNCGALTGPKGKEGLRIRTWTCDCGTRHDRDQNAEYNLRLEGRSIVAAGRADT
jgi:putative transposase